MTAPLRRALLSVSDKSGLVDLARRLAASGIELVSTGGTAKAVRDAGLSVIDVATITGFPEIMDGRVKTLHPLIHGGLLGRPDIDAAAIAAHGIRPIGLLVANLYPFERTVASGASSDDCVEMIDVGGPAMIRAAAKNHAHVAVVTDPEDYGAVAEAIGATGAIPAGLCRRLAAKAFALTARYDAAIADWMADDAPEAGATFPPRFAGAALRSTLRYGENPHQTAALYAGPGPGAGIPAACVVQGKALSYNNIADADAALDLVADLDRERPAIAIVKHANPCGVATADSLADAYGLALRSDPVSAFGGIVAANRPLDGPAARAITSIFTEVVVAPGADDEALAAFAAKPNLRLLLVDLPDPERRALAFRSLIGGVLLQGRDTARIRATDLKVVTRRAPSPREMDDLLFAFRVAKHVKSNAIVYAKDGATVGIGAGQMSRVDASRIAAAKAADAARAAGLAGRLTDGAVVASDAFFPFADGLEAAITAGATAVIQPGGSVRDDEVIAAADAAGLAMVFTDVRHFRH